MFIDKQLNRLPGRYLPLNNSAEHVGINIF
jgi:hypothetical protein